VGSTDAARTITANLVKRSPDQRSDIDDLIRSHHRIALCARAGISLLATAFRGLRFNAQWPWLGDSRDTRQMGIEAAASSPMTS